MLLSRKCGNAGDWSATDIRWHRADKMMVFREWLHENAIRDAEAGSSASRKLMGSQHVRTMTESNSALKQFAHVASHDLQEPLRTMVRTRSSWRRSMRQARCRCRHFFSLSWWSGSSGDYSCL